MMTQRHSRMRIFVDRFVSSEHPLKIVSDDAVHPQAELPCDDAQLDQALMCERPMEMTSAPFIWVVLADDICDLGIAKAGLSRRPYERQ
jgi:hypothetical protein